MGKICASCFRETVNEQGICTACGFDGAENREKYPLALPAGSILNGRYIIGKVLGQGGFGITYMARDHQQGQTVAIKEFFPDAMATRTSHTAVTPLTGEKGENFSYGKDTFLMEAKTMAEFIGNPNIVRVYSYFEENDTGYFVMEYVDGESFQSYLKRNYGRVSWEEALKVLLPVMDALTAVHEKGIIHRDIAPDNICIAKDGTVKLLDFGAARYSLGNVSQSLDVVLRHGFAPKEQYKRHGRQGPYTDIYALGATLYYAITGNRPDDAIERLDEDTLPLPSTLGANVEPWQEDVILKAMAIQPEDRYRSVAEFKAALTHPVTKPVPAPPPKPEPRPEQKPEPRPELQPEPKPASAPKAQLPKWLIPAGAAAVLVLGVLIGSGIGGDKEEKKLEAPATEAPVVIEPEMETPVLTVNVMAKDKGDLRDPESAYEYFWGQSIYERKDVETIRFQSVMEDVPLTAWDVSEAGDRSILAWMVDGNLTVAANGIIAPNPDAKWMFGYMSNLKKIDFGGCFDTSGVTSMYAMFRECASLESLELGMFDTSGVTSMGRMFEGCESLKTLDLSAFDTSLVTNMNCMFWKCKSLESVEVSGFNTCSVEDMGMMFSECSELKFVDVSGFDTSKVKSLNAMFNKCFALEDVDVSGFDTSNVNNMFLMFGQCHALSELDCSSFVTSGIEKTEDMRLMFSQCKNLNSFKCQDEQILKEYENR